MNERQKILDEIEKLGPILKESKENYDNNPDNYSAQLLLMSAENHLADLLKKLDSQQPS